MLPKLATKDTEGEVALAQVEGAARDWFKEVGLNRRSLAAGIIDNHRD